MSITYPTCESSIDTDAIQRRLAVRLQRPGMSVFELDPISDPRWRVFADLHPDATVFHRVEWLQALKECYDYEPRAFSLTPPGSPLLSGLVFCQIRSVVTGDRVVSLPFSDHCEPLVTSPEEFDLLLNSLTERVDRTGLKYAEVRPLRSEPSSRESVGASDEYCLHRLDLSGTESSLFKSFHKDSIQRKIRRAEREQLRYEEGSSEALLGYFYELFIMTRRRQGLPPQPRKWFRSLIVHLGKNIKIRVALKGDKPVASILTISDKKTMVYKYGCSDARFNNLGGTPLLFWRAIQDAKAMGLEEFDLGRSSMDNAGLATFKRHLGAQQTTMNYWRYPARAAAFRPEASIRHFKRLISLVPNSSLVMIGNLFYRHIG